MTLRVEIPFLGIEIFRVHLDGKPEPRNNVDYNITVGDRVVKGLSRWWVERTCK